MYPQHTLFTTAMPRSRTRYTEDFEQAFDAYAYRVAKRAAYAAWQRLDDDEKAAAMESIPAYVAVTDPYGNGGKRIRAHFATWLNGARWEDDIPLPSESAGVAMTYEDMAAHARANRLTVVVDYKQLEQKDNKGRPMWAERA
jgi:hypothetical protein